MGGRASRTGAIFGGFADFQPTRRTWLKAGILTLLAGPTAPLGAQSPREKAPSPDEEKAIAAVRDKAAKTGLAGFATRRTDHFVGVGNAAAGYSGRALELDERIARDFLDHFRKRGFKVDFPAHRLTVVTLKDGASYQSFGGEDPGETVGGHYDPEANWLVIFDFRTDDASRNAEQKRTNTFTLVHETIHLLCYNTGLLSRQADVPVCISEGLATYGELWTPPPRGRTGFGEVNKPRLEGLIQEMEQGAQWIPIARLLSDDKVFDDPKTYHVAYGESWALVHYLMEPERLPQFQAYLAGLPRVADGQKMSRDRYAESRLGSVRELDQAVRRHAAATARRVRLQTGVIRARG
jgi:hypothetical protein